MVSWSDALAYYKLELETYRKICQQVVGRTSALTGGYISKVPNVQGGVLSMDKFDIALARVDDSVAAGSRTERA